VRFMIRMRMPADWGNEVIKDARRGTTMQSILGELEPEATYLTTIDGCRGGYMLVDMEDASQISTVVEPLFLAFGATIEIEPVMSPEDFAAAAPAIEQAVHKYG
jgi:hypothetical protein